MNIYAIGDLHLSFDSSKPMNVFGPNWEGHFEKIKKDWTEKVKGGDVVLIPGDISWAMKLDDGLEDLKALKDLPGKKIFIRGNHDYWWNGITKLRDKAPDENFVFLQTDAVRLDEGFVVVGSRGWTCPGNQDFTAEDEKIYHRETERFSLALRSGEALKKEGDKVVAMIHFPPFNAKRENSGFTELFEKYGVEKVIFGHLHGPIFFPLHTEKNGIDYYLTSCDKLNFSLVKIY